MYLGLCSVTQQTAFPSACEHSGGKIGVQGFVICFFCPFTGTQKCCCEKTAETVWTLVTFLKAVRPAKQPERKDLTVLICFLWFMGGKNISHIIRAATERLY